MHITFTHVERILKTLLVFSCIALFICLSSCKKNDLIPAYIHIDKITLTSTYETDGSNSSKITDAWVYVDDNLIGIYELPATFPVLASGMHKITVKAGVKLNGIAMSRGYYPFYEDYTTDINLEEDKIDTINPIVTYYPNKVQWKEDFEEGGFTLLKYTGSDTAFIKTTDPAEAFEGSFSAVANLTTDDPYILAVSTQDYVIPQNLTPVFLELNYKTNTPLTVGMIEEKQSGDHNVISTLILNPNTEWNKIYINLTLTANTSVNVASFKVFFAAAKDTIPNPKLFIDNIKLLYTN
ncbi:MAG: hypothetical protein WCQ95_03255 [Bacteroidota bacterium]